MEQRRRRTAVSEQTEQFVLMMQDRLDTFKGDNSERDQGHYDGLIEALAIMMKALVSAGR